MGTLNAPLTTSQIRAEALTALASLQIERTTRKSRVLTLGASLLAFVITWWILMVWLKSFTITTLLILIVATLIHETSHYLAMHRFGYRNLKMFFIPFFGAAVGGYACVSVVKQSIVSLLGPLPGILIGCVFGVTYLCTRSSLWLDAAKIFIGLNMLNLLPLYPLDGGRFIFGILPQRTYRIQWLFQIAFAALSAFIGWCLNLNLIDTLLDFVLVWTWHFHKYNKLSAALLSSSVIKTQTQDDTIPAEIAPEIIAIIHQETYSSKPEEIAGDAWEAWSQVKAERPTLREVIYLLAAYLAAMSLALGARAVYLAFGG